LPANSSSPKAAEWLALQVISACFPSRFVRFEECNNNDNKNFKKTQAGNVDPQLISSALYKHDD
jgi:hypothetical protein